MPATIEAPPAAPVAPAPAAAPIAPAIPSGAHDPAGSEAFGDIDAMGTDDGKGDATPAPQPGKEGNTRGPDGKFAPKSTTSATTPAVPDAVKPDATKPAVPAPAPDKGAPPAAEIPAEKMAPKQLREAYEALKSKHKALETEHTTLKTKAAAPAEDPEKKVLNEKLTAREKRLAEIEDELRFSNYAKSEEYKQKFEAPFVEAFMAGRAKVASMKMANQTNQETGEVVPGRQATAEDFDQFMKIGDDDAAAEWAAEKFGHKAPLVLFHREKVQELNLARNKAIEEYRKTGSEREKTRSQEQETFRKSFADAVDANAKAASEKYPEWFQPDPADAKGNEVLDRGQHLVARVIANGQPVKEGDRPMTVEEYASAVAAVRQKAGAFDRLAQRHAAASKRIQELETELEQYKKSEPGPGDGRGAGGALDDETIEGALNKLDKEYAREG